MCNTFGGGGEEGDSRLASNDCSHARPLIHTPYTRTPPEPTRKVACPRFFFSPRPPSELVLSGLSPSTLCQ